MATKKSKQEQLLDIARGEIGVWEDAGPNEDKAGRIAQYRAAVTDGVPADRGPEEWCADFVSWCMREVGHPLGDKGRGFRSCTAMFNWLLDRDEAAYHGYTTPQAGDIIFIDANKNGKPDHVGLIERVHVNDRGEVESIDTIEGNYGDRVAQETRTKFDVILGYGFPLPDEG